MSTVGKHGDEQMLKNYVRNQGVDKSYLLRGSLLVLAVLIKNPLKCKRC